VLATAAALILIAGRVIVHQPTRATPGEIVGRVERIEGTPRRVSDGTSAAAGSLFPEDYVRAGEWMETGADARVSVRFSDGTSVRVDRGSRLRPLSSSVIELSSGAVYVDVERAATGFEVRTPVAVARDVGTQFEVRLLDGGLRLRVRTGVVELTDGTRSVSGRAGTEVALSATGAVSRPYAASGPDWEWAASLSDPVQIEGLTLSVFLERIARERGWTLRYSDPALAREASGIILHGSVSGLSTHDALEVAVTTSGVRHRLENGELLLFRRSGTK
jgi:ferric-dicitrate binding protein FerR (iron transport regulator)